MARHRNLKFVSVDAAKLETSIEKKMGLKPFHGSHLLVHFTRYNVTNPKVKGVPILPRDIFAAGRCHGFSILCACVGDGLIAASDDHRLAPGG